MLKSASHFQKAQVKIQ